MSLGYAMWASRVVESIRMPRGLIERVLTSDLMSRRLSSVIRSSPNLWLNLINVVASGPYPSTTDGRNISMAVFPNFRLNFFVAQSPAKLQIHHAQIDPYGCAGSAHALIENFFEGFDQRGIPQKLVDFLELVVRLVQGPSIKPSPKLIC